MYIVLLQFGDCQDMQQFWHLLSKHGLYFEEAKGIHLDFCLSALTGQFSENRASCVRQVSIVLMWITEGGSSFSLQIFKRLDSNKSGSVQVEQMKKYFINAVTDHDTLWPDMFSILNLRADQTFISYPDFENFHLGLSVEMSSDSKFLGLMKAYWGM